MAVSRERTAAAVRCAVVLVLLVGMFPGPAAAEVVRIGSQASGTLSWVLYGMERLGVDDAYGLQLEVTTYATKPATELALRAGEADIIVDDFINVVLMRERGVPVKAVYPFSLATGSVVVPAESEIRSLADLRSKRIGAASLGDKSLLILRALTSGRLGFDPQHDASMIAVSPPLMEELMERGELDAAIPFWHIGARLVGSGRYRHVMAVTEMLAELGLPTDLPILVIVARDGADPDLVRRFLQAFRETTARMRADDAVWQGILDEGLYSLPDPSHFSSVREAWGEGLPQSWSEETVEGLVRLVEALVEVAGPEVVGVAEIDPAAFTVELAP